MSVRVHVVVTQLPVDSITLEKCLVVDLWMCVACIQQAEALVAQGVELMNDRNLDEAYETFLKYAVCLCIAYKSVFVTPALLVCCC